MPAAAIAQSDDTLGFHWTDPAGRSLTLRQACALEGAEPHRWLPTHLEALDDVLIDVAGRFGEILGGGRAPSPEETDDLAAVYRAIDRSCAEYAEALAVSGLSLALRSGQIIGTGVLMSVRARAALGAMGPAPLDGTLDSPGPGVVGGHAGLVWVDESADWQGARWVVRTEDGRRLPATLSMLLFDSSGVLKDASLDEHRAALTRVSAAVTRGPVEPIAASGAVDWLLFDWLMAHRDGPDSGAVEIRSGKITDAAMIVDAAAASVAVRSRFDPLIRALPSA